VISQFAAKNGMNQRRLTDLDASFIMNDSNHACGVQFRCPSCSKLCYIEARWSDRSYPGEPLYSRAPTEGTTLENITIAPGIDTAEHHLPGSSIGGCGVRLWIHDGEVIWP
jgi:hypothetical protein